MKLYQSFISLILILVLTTLAGADDFESFSKDSRLGILSPPVRCFFNAASENDSKALAKCFTENVSVNIAGMKFNGPAEVVTFAERDIWGGKYKVESTFVKNNLEIVHCRFWPESWSSPEPPIEYQFEISKGKISRWLGKYR